MTDNVIFLADRVLADNIPLSDPPVLVRAVLSDLRDRLSDVNDLLIATAKLGEVPKSLPVLDLALEELFGSLKHLEDAAAAAANAIDRNSPDTDRHK